jgi:hypothetical protein
LELQTGEIILRIAHHQAVNLHLPVADNFTKAVVHISIAVLHD